jgi:hypothetical protein
MGDGLPEKRDFQALPEFLEELGLQQEPTDRHLEEGKEIDVGVEKGLFSL